MTQAIGIFNSALNYVCDGLLWPLRTLDPMWGMLWLSLITGLIMVWIYGKTSNQEALRRVKDSIRGHLIAVHLFRHDPVVVLRTQGRIFIHTLRYMRHAVVPMLVMLVPVLLIMVQLNRNFSERPLEAGEVTLVEATVRNNAALTVPLSLEAPDGITVETPPVRMPSTSMVAWRVRADQPGRHKLLVHVGDDAIGKEIVVDNKWRPVSARRTGKHIGDMLLWPGEAPLPADSPIIALEAPHKPLELRLFGFKLHWILWFLILAIIFGFAWKSILGIEV